MTFDELMAAVLAILPNATLDQDNEGQIIIYTNLTENADGVLVDLDDEE